MDKVELAASMLKEGFSCSQSVLGAYSEEFGLERQTALRIATAFGGGMGRMGETCGAVTGAFMVIGLKHGRTTAKDTESRERTYSLVKEFVQRFKSLNGSILCRELIGYDLSTPEGLKAAREKGVLAALCPKYVRDATRIVETLLR